MKTKFALIFIAVLAIGLFVIVSCEGPMGPQGPPGLVGPAGSDGSIIHAGQGAPDGNTGKPGDFYLDLTTGNLFGPKMTAGWGAPTNLQGPQGPGGPQGPEGPQGPSGEDGKDGEGGQNGQDGEDGQNGENGSQIYAGNGAPDSSFGKEGDYYLDKANYDLYGPKTARRWGTPINLQGPPGEDGQDGQDGADGEDGKDGNANVTLYIFEGHDFRDTADGGDGPNDGGCIEGLSEQETLESAWFYYLVIDNDFVKAIYSVPGKLPGLDGTYDAYIERSDLNPTCADDELVHWEIRLISGLADSFDNIHIIRIAAGNIVSKSIDNGHNPAGQNLIPEDLDVSDYNAVIEYYGLDEAEAIRQ